MSQMLHSTRVEVRGRIAGISSLLSPCGPRDETQAVRLTTSTFTHSHLATLRGREGERASKPAYMPLRTTEEVSSLLPPMGPGD